MPTSPTAPRPAPDPGSAEPPEAPGPERAARWRRRAGPLGLLALAGLTYLVVGPGVPGCSGGVEAGLRGVRRTLAWEAPRSGPGAPRPTGEAVEAGTPAGATGTTGTEVQRHWEVGAGLPPGWVLSQADRRHHTLEGGRPALRLNEGVPLRVQGPLRPGFGQVRVEAAAPQGGALELQLLRGGRDGVRTPPQALPPGTAPTTLIFDVPEARHGDAPFDQLQLRAHTRKGSLSVASVSLLRVPVDQGLPGPGRTGLVDVSGDRRAAGTLLTAHPLRAELRLGPREALEFDVGAPPGLLPPGLPLEVQVSLWPRTGPPQVRAFDLVANPGVSWRTLRVECEPRLVGQDLRAVVELVSGDFAEAALAISAPRLLRGRDPRVLLLVTVDALRADAVVHGGADPEDGDDDDPQADAPDDRRGARARARARASNAPMPHLDQRLRDGARAAIGRVTSDAARPVAASIATGRPCPDLGPVTLGADLPEDVATLAERLREAGWATALVTSDAEVGTTGGLERGFERVVGPQRGVRTDEVTTELALRTLVDLGPVPRFLWLHLSGPRAPYEAGPRHATRVAATRVDPERAELPELPAYQRVPWRPAVRDPEWVRGQYRAELLALDDRLEALLSQPALEGADWFLCGTTGEGLGEEHLYWRHDRLQPVVLEVPMVAGGPRLAGALPDAERGPAGLGRVWLDRLGLPALAFPDGLPRALPGEGANEQTLALGVDAEGRSACAWVDGRFARLALHAHRQPGQGEVPAHRFELFDLAAEDAAAQASAAEASAEGTPTEGDDPPDDPDDPTTRSAPPEPRDLSLTDPGARDLRLRMARALARRGWPAPPADCDCEHCAAPARD